MSMCLKTTKLTGEFEPAAIDPGLDRAFRQPQRVSDFLIRELLDVAHQDRGAQRVGQRRHRLAEEDDAIALLERGDRSGVVRDRRQLVRIDAAIAKCSRARSTRRRCKPRRPA